MQSTSGYILWLLAVVALLTPLEKAASQDLQRGVIPIGAERTQNVSPGQYYALVIGNNDYQFLPRLATARNDAQAVARVLRESYGFETSEVLDATRADILNAFAMYREKLPENSHLLIYYAGHGKDDPDAKVAYWQPVDADPLRTENWISSEDITAKLRVIKAAHILIVADSCYAGAMLRGADYGDLRGDMKPQDVAYYLAKLERIPSRTVLASGGKEPVADGGPDGHSIFAAVLLQSLKDMSSTEFTAASLFQKIVVRVAGRSLQTPQYNAIVNSGHDGGDFVFFHRDHPAEPMACCMVKREVPSSDSATSPSGGLRASADQELREILDQYRDAYRNEDIATIRKLWPSITPQATKNLQIFFQTASSVSMNYSIVGSPQIAEDTAVIDFVEDLSYSAGGRPKKLTPQRARMTLKRGLNESGRQVWRIDSIR